MNSYQKNISTKEMSREEWLQSRRIGIGGSDVSSILGFNPYKSALDVYLDKVGEEIKETPMNARMRAGLLLEDVVADWFSEETGLKVQKDNKIRIHKDYPFLIGNLDRLIISENGSGPGVLEIKTTSGFVARSWEAGEVPLHYFSQLQHYLSVTGYKYGYFAVLVDGYDFRLYRQERDDDFIEIMNKRLIDFWKQVELGTPPDPATSDDVLKLFPISKAGEVIPATDETYKHFKILTEVRERLKELEEQEKKLKESFMMIMKDAETLEHDGKKLITWKNTKDRSTFDKEKFQTENPELYTAYIKTVPGSRVFKIYE